jgi:hypothetical protein
LLRAAAPLCLLAASTWVAAQYRVNTRVNTGLYGAGTYNTGSVRAAPYQTSALPSQTRHAYWSSGMSRSDVRANYSAMGPMASGGAISYVSPSRTREAVRGPLDVAPPSATGARASLPPVGSAVVTTPGRGGGTPALGSVTYSTGGSSRAASPNGALGAGGISGGGPVSWGGSAGAGASGTSQLSSSPAGKSSVYDPSNDGRFDAMINGLKPEHVISSGSIRYSDPIR